MHIEMHRHAVSQTYVKRNETQSYTLATSFFNSLAAALSRSLSLCQIVSVLPVSLFPSLSFPLSIFQSSFLSRLVLAQWLSPSLCRSIYLCLASRIARSLSIHFLVLQFLIVHVDPKQSWYMIVSVRRALLDFRVFQRNLLLRKPLLSKPLLRKPFPRKPLLGKLLPWKLLQRESHLRKPLKVTSSKEAS